MPSPFPGMNPFLEQSDTWEDFHNNYFARAQEQLSRLVGEGYYVKIEVRLYVHELPADERQYFGDADVRITGLRDETRPAPTTTTLVAPLRLQLQLSAVHVERQVRLEIRDRRDRHVVTALELLSPSNKSLGPDRDDYLRKRKQILRSNTHFLEIDLRRGGTRPPSPKLPLCDYYALVSRWQDRPDVDVWPIRLRERLPVIPVSRTPPDDDVPLDLQALLHQVYDATRYDKYVYGETPQPPLSPEDQAWAAQFIPQK